MKIAFFVEGNQERAAVEQVARRLLPRGVKMHVVRLGGKAALGTAYTSVPEMLAKGYEHVFIIVNAATPQDAATDVRQVDSTLREYGLTDRATVLPAIPDLSAWLNAEADADATGLNALKSKLASLTAA